MQQKASSELGDCGEIAYLALLSLAAMGFEEFAALGLHQPQFYCYWIEHLAG